MSSLNHPVATGSNSKEDDSPSHVSPAGGTVSQPSAAPKFDLSIKPVTFPLRREGGGFEEFLFNFQSQKSSGERYEMKNKAAHQLFHPIVSLTPFLQTLYCLRGSLVAHCDCEELVVGLMQFYKFATRFEHKRRFPATGVYVDLDSGTCSTYYHYVMAVLWKHKSSLSQLDPRMLEALVTFHLDPLIRLLEEYGSHFEKKSSHCGIYDRKFFEDVHSARWVEAKENNESGHYEGKNLEALAARPFVDLNTVLRILYSWRIWDEGNWLLEEDHPVALLKRLFKNPVYLVKMNVRFPADGVYLDIAKGRSHQLLSSIVQLCGCFHLDNLSKGLFTTTTSACIQSTATASTSAFGLGTFPVTTPASSQATPSAASSAFLGSAVTLAPLTSSQVAVTAAASTFRQGTDYVTTPSLSKTPGTTPTFSVFSRCAPGYLAFSQGAVTVAASVFGQETVSVATPALSQTSAPTASLALCRSAATVATSACGSSRATAVSSASSQRPFSSATSSINHGTVNLTPPVLSSSIRRSVKGAVRKSFQSLPTPTAPTPFNPPCVTDVSCSKCAAMAMSRSALLAMLEDYESHWDDPRNGIYDRAHFENHFSARWLPLMQSAPES